MTTRRFQIVLLLILVISPLLAHAADPTVFSARVIRIEPWSPVKISCGIAIVTRLAEYEVTTVYRGKLDSRRVIVQHLACNGDELDNLKAGDDVFVVATHLKEPSRRVWRKLPFGDEDGLELVVRFKAVEVAKRVYPTQASSPQP